MGQVVSCPRCGNIAHPVHRDGNITTYRCSNKALCGYFFKLKVDQ